MKATLKNYVIYVFFSPILLNPPIISKYVMFTLTGADKCHGVS